MKSKTNLKLLMALTLIITLALAPISTVAFAQTQGTEPMNEDIEKTNTNEEADKEKKRIKDEIKEKMRELREDRKQKLQDMREELAEKYNDRIRPDLNTDVRPDVMPDREPDLYFKGDVNGWAMIGGKAIDAYTSLTGKAYHVRGNMWNVHVTSSTIEIGERTVTAELNGVAKGHRLTLQGIVDVSDDKQVRIGIMGKYAPTQEEGKFALVLTKLSYHTENNSGRIHLAEVGEVYVEPNHDLPEPPRLADSFPDTFVEIPL